jgi:hypothetical protein
MLLDRTLEVAPSHLLPGVDAAAEHKTYRWKWRN